MQTVVPGVEAAGQPAAQPTVREGDWTCPACNNHNYANRVVCNRCGEAKPPPDGKGQPGDWMCPSCNNHNYRNRQVCNKCGFPRPGGGKGGMGYMAGLSALGVGGKGGWGPGYGMKGGMKGGPQAGGFGFRPGDWVCAACRNHNYANREVCNKCGGPKTEQPAYGAAPGGGMNSRFAPYSMAGMGVPGRPGMRPGDWMCGSCGNHNYASRDMCNKCNAPRPAQPPPGAPPNFRQGDWMCLSCNNHNYASKTACNKCGAPKPPDAA